MPDDKEKFKKIANDPKMIRLMKEFSEEKRPSGLYEPEKVKEFADFYNEIKGKAKSIVDKEYSQEYAKGGDVKKKKMAAGGMTSKQQAKVGKVMKEFKEKTLHAGKDGKVVKNPKQAVAIALSEARRTKKK